MAAFETAWGGEWAHTLMMMQEEAPDTYRALQSHVVSQIRRARRGSVAAAPAEGGPDAQPDDAGTASAAGPARSAVSEGGPRRAAARGGAERRRTTEPVA